MIRNECFLAWIPPHSLNHVRRKITHKGSFLIQCTFVAIQHNSIKVILACCYKHCDKRYDYENDIFCVIGFPVLRIFGRM